MKKTWKEYSITLKKEDKEVEIVVAFDNTIQLDSCFIQKRKGVFTTIKIKTLFNLIKDYAQKGYIIFDWDQIIPEEYKL